MYGEQNVGLASRFHTNLGASAVSHQADDRRNKALLVHAQHDADGVCFYTLLVLKSDVTRRDHVVNCHGSQECWFTLCQFRSQRQSSHNSEIYNIGAHA